MKMTDEAREALRRVEARMKEAEEYRAVWSDEFIAIEALLTGQASRDELLREMRRILGDLRHGIFPDTETVNALIDEGLTKLREAGYGTPIDKVEQAAIEEARRG